MADQPLLSDLCSICHADIPKYRCPACSTRTCALKCVQLHKQRGCSGKRDPTAYVKKSQLATPAGIDHDYNFIAGIERSRDRAEERLLENGITASHARSHGLNNAGFINRQRRAGVKIEYAPVGMSRQKLNKTRFSKSRRILWTVEWIHDDDTSTIGAILDDVPISQEYSAIHLKRQGQQSTRKRKRENGGHAAVVATSSEATEQPYPVDEKSTLNASEEDSTLGNDDQGLSQAVPSPEHTQQPSAPDLVPMQIILPDEAQDPSAQSRLADKTIMDKDQALPEIAVNVKEEPESSKKQTRDTSALSSAIGSPDQYGLYYYLVKPRTTGPQRVLIPLSPADSFLVCLSDQTVLEFPSVQVLPQGPHALTTGYITADNYASRVMEEALDMERLIKDEEGEAAPVKSEPRADHECKHIDQIFDPSAVMAKLDQDIKREHY